MHSSCAAEKKEELIKQTAKKPTKNCVIKENYNLIVLAEC
jgi:hypothetical protein